MFTKRLVCVGSFLICCIAMAGGQERQPREGAADVPKTPDELRQQLVATAEEGRRTAEQAYRAGLGTADEMFAWMTRWTEARLAAASDRQGRLDALKDAVKVAEQREHDVQGRQRAGMATQTDLIAARYMRLQAELALVSEPGK